MGIYNAAPSRRMAWDSDGSVVLRSESDNNGTGPSPGGFGSIPWSEASSGERINGNDEDPSSVLRTVQAAGVANAHLMVAILFPEPRELDAMYVVATATTPANFWMYYSLDTTNGVDGTWINTAVPRDTDLSLDHYRDNITTIGVSGVKGIKGNLGGTNTNDFISFRTIHIYGGISPGETPDRILFLDTEDADNAFTQVLDFEEVPRGQTQTRTYKLKNNSSTKTINTIQITAEDLYLNAGDWYEFSDSGAFQGTLAIGNLGPGATQLITLKQIIPDAETLSVQAGRIKITHASVT